MAEESTLRVEQSDCVCAPGASTGVKPIHLVARENIEVWGACEEGGTRPYEFGCNHRLLAKGESVTLPDRAVSDYSGHGAHFHVRPRREDPHGVSKRPWQEIRLSSCSCD